MQFEIFTNNFTIISDTLYIHREFNESIDLNLISGDHTKIIFSNYNDIQYCIKYNNLNCGGRHYKISEFNSIIILPNNLTHLTFGGKFNQSVNLTNNLTHLIFGNDFNQPVILTNNLTHLTFGNNFNQPVILTDNLTHLTFGCDFNQLMTLPQSLIYLELSKEYENYVELINVEILKINCNNINLIDNLSNHVRELILGYSFNLPINNLPNSIKKIVILNKNYNHDINNLPHFVEYLELNLFYDKQILNFPKNLCTVKCSWSYRFLNDLSNYAVELY